MHSQKGQTPTAPGSSPMSSHAFCHNTIESNQILSHERSRSLKEMFYQHPQYWSREKWGTERCLRRRGIQWGGSKEEITKGGAEDEGLGGKLVEGAR